MSENQINVYQFLLGYLKQSVADLSEEELDSQPVGAGNPPRWILGHLAICCDYALRQLGAKPVCPKEWHVAFGPGSDPKAPGVAKPTKDELVAALTKGHEEVVTAYRQATEEALAAPHGIEFLSLTPLKNEGGFGGSFDVVARGGSLGSANLLAPGDGPKGVFSSH